MADDNDLIPLRALNQVTYCERLYYLEYVESVMPINEHVEDGLFQHRRVDDPELHAGVTDNTSARLWAAALAFPINQRSALRAAATLDPLLKGLSRA